MPEVKETTQERGLFSSSCIKPFGHKPNVKPCKPYNNKPNKIGYNFNAHQAQHGGFQVQHGTAQHVSHQSQHVSHQSQPVSHQAQHVSHQAQHGGHSAQHGGFQAQHEYSQHIYNHQGQLPVVCQGSKPQMQNHHNEEYYHREESVEIYHNSGCRSGHGRLGGHGGYGGAWRVS